MKKNKTKIKLKTTQLFLIFSLMFFLSFQAKAENILKPVDCFEYYDFGSVYAEFQSLNSHTVSGATVKFKGEIINKNNYPVVEGILYAKVFRLQNNQVELHSNGDFLIDQFIIKDNINLKANGKYFLVFDWKVPSYAISGDYRLATYFISANKFNLSGLSFTDDITGGTANFHIEGERSELIQFNKNVVKINNDEYDFIQSTPEYGKDEKVLITAELENQTSQLTSVPIVWKLYKWDGINGENLIEEKKEEINIGVGEKKSLSYEISHNSFPVYFVVAETRYQDTKSIINIRFSRQGVNMARLNYVASSKFPIKKGERAELFVCAHGMGWAEAIDENKLVLEIYDEKGELFSKYDYEGYITGSVMGFNAEFISPEDLYDFILKARLYHKDKLIDEVEMNYNCKNIDGSICPADSFAKHSEKESKQEKSVKEKALLSLVVFLIILFASLIIVFIVKKRKKPGFPIIIFILAIIGGMFFAGDETMAGKSTKYSKSFSYSNPDRTNGRKYDFEIYGRTAASVGITSASVVYRVKVTDSEGMEFPDGSVVPVGTKIRFVKDSSRDSDIQWFLSGYTWDTPYGYWKKGASSCIYDMKSEYKGEFHGGTGQQKYSKVDLSSCYSVDEPELEVTHSGTAQLICNEEGTDCMVESPGTIEAVFNFKENKSVFYSKAVRYEDGNSQPIKVSDKKVVFEGDGFNLEGPGFGYINGEMEFKVLYERKDWRELPKRFSKGNIYSKIKYGVDWDFKNPIGNDLSPDDIRVDQWFERRGTSYYFQYAGDRLVFSNVWNTTGKKTFAVVAADEDGNRLGLAVYTIEIKETPTLYDIKEKSLLIPNQTITYFLEAAKKNNPPITPEINGPEVGYAHQEAINKFNIFSSDSEGEKIRYGVDWDCSDIQDMEAISSEKIKINEWFPADGFVNSGIKMEISKAWINEGEKKFCVVAEDESGVRSAWSSHSINIEKTDLDLSIKPGSIKEGEAILLAWSDIVNAEKCEASEDNKNPLLAEWKGEKALTGGLESINLTQKGDYAFILGCDWRYNNLDLYDGKVFKEEKEVNVKVKCEPDYEYKCSYQETEEKCGIGNCGKEIIIKKATGCIKYETNDCIGSSPKAVAFGEPGCSESDCPYIKENCVCGGWNEVKP